MITLHDNAGRPTRLAAAAMALAVALALAACGKGGAKDEHAAEGDKHAEHAGEKKGEEDFEGCTPGFWRNHLAHWAATPYSPGDLVNDTFGCDLVSDDALTLGEVIDAPQTYGALAFHAIAALLNSTHPDVEFGLDEAGVLTAACSGDKDTLSEANEEGCPLSGGNTTGGGGGPVAHASAPA